MLAFNDTANQLFGFERYPAEQRNLLWILFTDVELRERLPDWETQAVQMLSSFRRDYAHATQEADIQALVMSLKKVSSEFGQWWSRYDVHVPCPGKLDVRVDGRNAVFEHTSMTIDADRHLRLVVYAEVSCI